jgi:hypothetical protein
VAEAARSALIVIHENLADAALEMMERNMRAELTPCADVRFSAAA